MTEPLIYRAKSILTHEWVYGSYFQMPSINLHCVIGDINQEYLEKNYLKHYIVGYVSMGLTGLPNKALVAEIDPTTPSLDTEN